MLINYTVYIAIASQSVVISIESMRLGILLRGLECLEAHHILGHILLIVGWIIGLRVLKTVLWSSVSRLLRLIIVLLNFVSEILK